MELESTMKYEASSALANAEVEIAFDPMNTEMKIFGRGVNCRSTVTGIGYNSHPHQ